MTTMQPIVMYSTQWCPDCRRAKQFFDERGVPYTAIDIENDPDAARRVLELNGGMSSVPTIVFGDGSVLVEPSNRELAQKLNLS